MYLEKKKAFRLIRINNRLKESRNNQFHFNPQIKPIDKIKITYHQTYNHFTKENRLEPTLATLVIPPSMIIDRCSIKEFNPTKRFDPKDNTNYKKNPSVESVKTRTKFRGKGSP